MMTGWTWLFKSQDTCRGMSPDELSCLRASEFRIYIQVYIYIYFFYFINGSGIKMETI